jgi:hypothetical protein
MSRHRPYRLALCLAVVALLLIPLSYTALGQENQEHTQYYDPRYTNDLPVTELPATAGELPLLGLAGVFFLTGAAGLQMVIRSASRA